MRPECGVEGREGNHAHVAAGPTVYAVVELAFEREGEIGPVGVPKDVFDLRLRRKVVYRAGLSSSRLMDGRVCEIDPVTKQWVGLVAVDHPVGEALRDAVLTRRPQSPVPPGQGHAGDAVAGCQLEIVEIGPMPRQEQEGRGTLRRVLAKAAGHAMQPGEKAIAAVVRYRHHLAIGVAKGADLRARHVVNAWSDAEVRHATRPIQDRLQYNITQSSIVQPRCLS